jgi:hypothetical protein
MDTVILSPQRRLWETRAMAICAILLFCATETLAVLHCWRMVSLHDWLERYRISLFPVFCILPLIAGLGTLAKQRNTSSPPEMRVSTGTPMQYTVWRMLVATYCVLLYAVGLWY